MSEVETSLTTIEHKFIKHKYFKGQVAKLTSDETWKMSWEVFGQSIIINKPLRNTETKQF